MPGINGLEPVRRMRAVGFPGKIIIFSSELEPAIQREYLECKVDVVLPKPVFPADFRRVWREQFAALYPATSEAAPVTS